MNDLVIIFHPALFIFVMTSSLRHSQFATWVIFSSDLSMMTPIMCIVMPCLSSLHQLRSLRQSVSSTTFQQLTEALSVLDWLENAVLSRLDRNQCQPLQSATNTSARIIFQARSYDNVCLLWPIKFSIWHCSAWMTTLNLSIVRICTYACPTFLITVVFVLPILHSADTTYSVKCSRWGISCHCSKELEKVAFRQSLFISCLHACTLIVPFIYDHFQKLQNK